MFVARSIAADHRDLIHDVSFDFHGRRMATCSSDQSVKVSPVPGRAALYRREGVPAGCGLAALGPGRGVSPDTGAGPGPGPVRVAVSLGSRGKPWLRPGAERVRCRAGAWSQARMMRVAGVCLCVCVRRGVGSAASHPLLQQGRHREAVAAAVVLIVSVIPL